MPDTLIILPTYNEADNLRPMTERLMAMEPALEVLVVATQAYWEWLWRCAPTRAVALGPTVMGAAGGGDVVDGGACGGDSGALQRQKWKLQKRQWRQRRRRLHPGWLVWH